jgi:hypothetical protein
MLSGIPNFVFVVGYTNASWTLKADLISQYVCRLIEYMDTNSFERCVPVKDPTVDEQPFMDFTPGYVLRAIEGFPKQGSRLPWKLKQNYPYDVRILRHLPIEDEALDFSA